MSDGCDDEEFGRKVRYLVEQGFAPKKTDPSVLIKGPTNLSLIAIRLGNWDDITIILFEERLLRGS